MKWHEGHFGTFSSIKGDRKFKRWSGRVTGWGKTRFPHAYLFLSFPSSCFSPIRSFFSPPPWFAPLPSFLSFPFHLSHTRGITIIASEIWSLLIIAKITKMSLTLNVNNSFVITPFHKRFAPTRSWNHPLSKYAKKNDKICDDKIHPRIFQFSQLGHFRHFTYRQGKTDVSYKKIP